MLSWVPFVFIVLLCMSSLLQARLRADSKRHHSMSSPTASSLLFDEAFYPTDDVEENNLNNGNFWMEQPTTTAFSMPASTSMIQSPNAFRASDVQIQQFTRLLFDRLNLKEPPNVTMNISDENGFPSSIVKQLEQQAKQQQNHHDYEEFRLHQQKQLKMKEDILPMTERAILSGDYIPNHTCQRQLHFKFQISQESLINIDCYRFIKSIKDSSLPTDQTIKALRLFVKRNYFNFNEQYQSFTPDMFHIYQVFRPTTNNTLSKPPHGLIGTTRILINQVKELSDHWFELEINSSNDEISLQQLYNQFIMPWYALAIDRDLRQSLISSSSFTRHNRYHQKKHRHLPRSNNNEENLNREQQHPFMLVEYGPKLYSPSASGHRGTRGISARPARGCEPTSPCCRRSLTIDLDQGNNALNFVIYPRQLDIGECVGMCGPSGSSLRMTDVKNAQYNRERNSAYNLFLLQHAGLARLNKTTTTTQANQPQHPSSQCCSYSRTGGLELMYTTTNGGPIIRKFVPNMVVEECKCGLPATIQEV